MPFFAAAHPLFGRFVLAARTFAATAAVMLGAFMIGVPAVHALDGGNVRGWAWSGSLGWISMNCANTVTCETALYGVTFNETPGLSDRSDLSGYAWSEAAGWICFGSTCAGTTPEGTASYAQYRLGTAGNADQIFGWAKIVNLGTEGWISLNCDKDVGTDDCSTPRFLKLDPTTGNFTSGAANDHWGWGVDSSGKGAGWVDFSGVTTSWVMANLGKVMRPQGVFEPQPTTTLPGTHLSTFAIKFTPFSASEGQLLECDILLSPDTQQVPPPPQSTLVVKKVITSSVRNFTQTLEHTIQPTHTVAFNRIWTILECRIAGAALGAACTSDAQCSPPSGICDGNNPPFELGTGRCRSVIRRSGDRLKIFTHGNTWTGGDTRPNNVTELDQDAAIRCFNGSVLDYFENTVQCDISGDASFALAMRRGIPVEGICDDGIDNDGNGQYDCADRYCQGISFSCKTQKEPLQCRYNVTNDGINDCDSATYSAGDACCTQQPVSPGATTNTVVNGTECTYRDPKDGYFDCDCLTSANANASYGCYSPYYRRSTTSPAYVGDLCCNSSSQVTRF